MRPIDVTMQRPWPEETRLPMKVILFLSDKSASSEMSRGRKIVKQGERKKSKKIDRERECVCGRERERSRYRKRERETW